jgi:hypothetical protein
MTRISRASVAAPGFLLCAGDSPLFWRLTHGAANACELFVAHPTETPEKWGGGANRSAQKKSWRATRPTPRNCKNEFPAFGRRWGQRLGRRTKEKNK